MAGFTIPDELDIFNVARVLMGQRHARHKLYWEKRRR